jgi:hypothetical protein
MKIAVVPQYPQAQDDTIFEQGAFDPLQLYGVDRPGFVALRENLEAKGHTIATIDRLEMSEIDACLFVDINYYYLTRLLQADNSPKLIYLTREPATEVPFNSAASLLSHRPLFDRILTWNDELAANHDQIFSFNLPYCPNDFRYDERQSFENRTLLTNISTRRYSTHPNELYSARKRVIKFYENNYPTDFTFYGKGWNQRPSPMELFRGDVFPDSFECYGGLVDEKITAYHRYRFAVCFENVFDIPGYITEKIFDCFRAGTVPIYWGANNVDEYIPEGAFIDYREFVSPADLHDYLTSISKSEYNEYLNAAQTFLETDDQFTPQQFGRTVSKQILSTPDTDKSGHDYLIDEIEQRSHLDRMIYDPERVSKFEYVTRYAQLVQSNPRLLAKYPQATYFGLRRVLPGKIGGIL